MMRNAALAALISLGIHGVLACLVMFIVHDSPPKKNAAALDLSHVDFSFAEKENAAAHVATSPRLPPSPAPQGPDILPTPPTVSRQLACLTPPAALQTFASCVPPSPAASSPVPMTTSEALVESAPQQAEIDAPPTPRHTITPDYPRSARLRGEEGAVTLEVAIDADGFVTAAKVLVSSGFAALDAAALKAIERATFNPAQAGNHAISTVVRQTLSFRLRP